MWRLFKALIFLSILGGIGLVGFAYLGPIFMRSEFAPPAEQVIKPVELDLGG